MAIGRPTKPYLMEQRPLKRWMTIPKPEHLYCDPLPYRKCWDEAPCSHLPAEKASSEKSAWRTLDKHSWRIFDERTWKRVNGAPEAESASPPSHQESISPPHIRISSLPTSAPPANDKFDGKSTRDDEKSSTFPLRRSSANMTTNTATDAATDDH